MGACRYDVAGAAGSSWNKGTQVKKMCSYNVGRILACSLSVQSVAPTDMGFNESGVKRNLTMSVAEEFPDQRHQHRSGCETNQQIRDGIATTSK